MALTSGFRGPRHPIGMFRGDPNRPALIDKMTNNAASEKSGPSEHRHNPICHGYRFPELDAHLPSNPVLVFRQIRPINLPRRVNGLANSRSLLHPVLVALQLLLPVRHSRMAMCPCMASFIRLWNSFPGMWIKLR